MTVHTHELTQLDTAILLRTAIIGDHFKLRTGKAKLLVALVTVDWEQVQGVDYAVVRADQCLQQQRTLFGGSANGAVVSLQLTAQGGLQLRTAEASGAVDNPKLWPATGK